jgi:hypothetical protein
MNPVGIAIAATFMALAVVVGVRLEAASINVIAATIAGFAAGALVTAMLFTLLARQRPAMPPPTAPPPQQPQWVVLPPAVWPAQQPMPPQPQSLPYPPWEQPRRRFTVIGDDGSATELEPDA